MIKKNPELSVLVAARKNSKFLAKFLFNYMAMTEDRTKCELLVMTSAQDTWNKELIDVMKLEPDMQFYTEDRGHGRHGLHEYMNDLLKEAKGKWIIYFCEDHNIVMPNWDLHIRRMIEGKLRELPVEPPLDHRDVWCLIPKFDNVGAMNQIFSRGYLDAIGHFGKHSHIDSYFNLVNAHIPALRTIRFDEAMFHDFTHDVPNPISEEHSKIELDPDFKPDMFDTSLNVKGDAEKDGESLMNLIRLRASK